MLIKYPKTTGIIVLGAILTPYFHTFNGALSQNSSDWANFGAYFGGVSTGIGLLFLAFNYALEKEKHDNKTLEEEEKHTIPRILYKIRQINTHIKDVLAARNGHTIKASLRTVKNGTIHQHAELLISNIQITVLMDETLPRLPDKVISKQLETDLVESISQYQINISDLVKMTHKTYAEDNIDDDLKNTKEMSIFSEISFEVLKSLQDILPIIERNSNFISSHDQEI